MYDLLKGLRIVEGASFIAAPSCGLHLLQLGAEVIRFDPIGGGPDYTRWPLGSKGSSLYWEGLNKGKKSIVLDLARPQGRELAVRLATAPGANAGIFLTNYPARGFLAHERLAAIREDQITVRVLGWADGSPAVDYTINSAVGLPYMTGPPALGDTPVNHVLPAWDLLTGASAAYALLAAERFRRDTGRGQEVRVPLSDVALATLGHLGQIAEVTLTGADRPRTGNELFGAFGRDFVTQDGRRIMIVAITARQWSGLLKALDIGDAVARLETQCGVSFARDEGQRFVHRAPLFALLEQALARRDLASLLPAFDELGVCWGPYQTLTDAVTVDERFSQSTILSEVAHPSGERYPTTGPAVSFTGLERAAPGRAPKLGEHTDEVLADVLGLPQHEIARLHDQGLVAGPEE
jgi:2-methylfumaryl-CoA isomerase